MQAFSENTLVDDPNDQANEHTCSDEVGWHHLLADFIPDIPVIHDALGCESEVFGQVVAAAPNYQLV